MQYTHYTSYTILRSTYYIHRTTYTVHRTIYIPYNVYHNTFDILHTPYYVHCTMHTVQYTPYNVHITCTPYYIHRTTCTIPYIYHTMYTILFTPYYVRRTSYAVSRAMYNVHYDRVLWLRLWELRAHGGDGGGGSGGGMCEGHQNVQGTKHMNYARWSAEVAVFSGQGHHQKNRMPFIHATSSPYHRPSPNFNDSSSMACLHCYNENYNPCWFITTM